MPSRDVASFEMMNNLRKSCMFLKPALKIKPIIYKMLAHLKVNLELKEA